MSITSKVFNIISGNGESIAKPIDAFGSAVDKIFTNDEERMSAIAVLKKA